VLLMLHHYALNDHVFSDNTDPSLYLARLDRIVVTWILGTHSPELHEIIREPTGTARQVWLMIEAQFLGKSASHILHLDARFRAFKQVGLSVSDYCYRMEGMADDFRAFGETIIDRYLILNLP
jgi:hypothetical protein